MNVSSDSKRQDDLWERFNAHAVYIYIPTAMIVTAVSFVLVSLEFRNMRLENERKARTEMNAVTSQQDQPSETKKQ